MKMKKRKNGQSETTFEYDSILEIKACRYKLLKKIIESEQSVTLIIDTNQKIREIPFEPVEQYMLQTDIIYTIMPVRANDSTFFGFRTSIGRKKAEEKLLVMEVSSRQFTEQLYDALKNYDIAVGIGRQKPFKDTCENLLVSESNVLFNSSFFKESVYDSVVCSSIRSSENTGKCIEAAIHEMDI